ncbi:MAG TPA: TonB-dependent receptor [Polyangia bacterium]|nr:TonB-dependent receptor [Polyangia bacterium]
MIARASFEGHSATRRVRRVVLALVAAGLLLEARGAFAQETTGRIVGRIIEEATHAPAAGLTVVLQGQQGEDATLTDENGEYSFVNLAVGTYVVRFYNATSSTNVERGNLAVSAASTLRVDAEIPSQAAAQETYVIQKKAAAVDVGSGRLGLTLNEEYMTNLPLDRTFGDLVLKAPGAFLESSGGVSIAGSSGLENAYSIDGLNVTGMEFGDIMNKASNASGGSNLSLNFIKELQINTGGYRAEYGGAMGGVVSVITKSGSNEFHGSAFLYSSPYWLSGDTKQILQSGSVLSGRDKPDYDTDGGFEVGGPLIKNKLFFWVGFAPRLEKSHYFRDVTPLVDADGDGVADTVMRNGQAVNVNGPVLLRTRSRELRQSYQYGTKVDFVVNPDHKLTVSLFGTPTASEHTRALNGAEANADPAWAMQALHKNNTDVMATWMSQFLDRRLRLDASAGLHRETMTSESPTAALNSLNQLEWYGGNLGQLEGIAACNPVTYANGTTFDPCPVANGSGPYHNGGYGETKSFTGNRWMADVKATALINRNEIKAGAHLEYNTFDQTRYYSGPLGDRRLVQIYPGFGSAPWSFFTIPPGYYASQFDPGRGNDPSALYDPKMPFYRDSLVANVSSINSAYFLQDSIHPIQNLSVDLGLRLENQRMYDYLGNGFMNVLNLAPRLGVVFDPSNEGRSKLFASYGQFYEYVPMNLAARYFGGEGIAIPIYTPEDSCASPTQWKGAGGTFDSRTCTPALTQFANGGAPYPVQKDLRGQFHHEIIAGLQHALTGDLVVGLNFTHRWLGAILEDGAADSNFQSVLANPGHVPQEAIDQVSRDIADKSAQLAAAQASATATEAEKGVLQAQLDTLNTKKNALVTLGKEPKPERTYDALTLTVAKRLARNWLFQGSYTYSRLIGNYNGLYDADNSYFAPNGNNAYDTPDLVLNKRGPLANDRPHSGHVDAVYQLPVGKGLFTAGLAFSAYSGVPRNYVAALFSGQQLVFLLPRGSAGRTPTVTQADLKFGYRRELTKDTAIEAFFDVFNIYNERTALRVDDNYTFESAGAIVNGNANDLKYAKNASGLPITKNPNFGQPTAYQAPIHGRLGVRFLF